MRHSGYAGGTDISSTPTGILGLFACCSNLTTGPATTHAVASRLPYRYRTCCRHLILGTYHMQVLTVSDRASTGVYEDLSGPAILLFFVDAVESTWRVLVP